MAPRSAHIGYSRTWVHKRRTLSYHQARHTFRGSRPHLDDRRGPQGRVHVFVWVIRIAPVCRRGSHTPSLPGSHPRWRQQAAWQPHTSALGPVRWLYRLHVVLRGFLGESWLLGPASWESPGVGGRGCGGGGGLRHLLDPVASRAGPTIGFSFSLMVGDPAKGEWCAGSSPVYQMLRCYQVLLRVWVSAYVRNVSRFLR